MDIRWAFGSKEISGYEELVSCYPVKEFDSPFRSTIPHLLFWRSAEKVFPEFCRYLGSRPSSCAKLSFEYQVNPFSDRGKASHTDLMLTWDNHCAAIEAKYLEPEYDTVEQWLEKGDRDNRLMVVKGWCELLHKAPDQISQWIMLKRLIINCSIGQPQFAPLKTVFGT